MTPDQIRADDDDSDRQRSTFDRADNTARLTLELAEAKREIARLHRDALAEARAYRAMFTRAQEAEARLAPVEALRARYGERAENGCPVSLNYARAHRDLTTALGIEP